MTPFVTAAVLVAAFCHASWNAMIRGGGDKLIGMALLVAGSGLIAIPFLPFVPVPPAAAWPWLIASVVIHLGYNGFLALSYTHGELSRAYPILRGLAPLMTLAVSLAFLGEGVDALEATGIVVLGIGIIVLAFEHGWRAVVASPQGLGFALATSVCITAYTFSDGFGARASGSALSYVLWLFALDAFPTLLIALWLRGARAVATGFRTRWPIVAVGGFLSLAAYGIVIWAMTVAPIPIVAALRETSILFAALLAILFLGERLTPIRSLSIALVVIGIALIRL
jgi:drug/metabolite transporter (DMT)-like permease